MADQQQNSDSPSLTDIELERLKMYQDTFKHMTTFCSGAIVLVSVVTGALIPKPAFVVGLVGSILMFTLGVLSAMYGLGLVARHMDSAVEGSTKPPISPRTWLEFSVVGASGGLALFAVFALRNLVPA